MCPCLVLDVAGWLCAGSSRWARGDAHVDACCVARIRKRVPMWRTIVRRVATDLCFPMRARVYHDFMPNGSRDIRVPLLDQHWGSPRPHCDTHTEVGGDTGVAIEELATLDEIDRVVQPAERDMRLGCTSIAFVVCPVVATLNSSPVQSDML